MYFERATSHGGSLSGRRISAIAVVTALHLGLLIALLRPTGSQPFARAEASGDTSALLLRFIEPVTPLRPPAAVNTPRSVVRSALRNTAPIRSARATIAAPPQDMSNTTPTLATGTPVTNIPSEATTGDGGFQERLRNAQHASDVRGVPGSDTRVVSGIQLVNPMSQGIGAVLRKTQRLFGVTNRHCINVGVWRNLSPDERVARHISLRDIDRTDDQYGCTHPPGLSF